MVISQQFFYTLSTRVFEVIMEVFLGKVYIFYLRVFPASVTKLPNRSTSDTMTSKSALQLSVQVWTFSNALCYAQAFVDARTRPDGHSPVGEEHFGCQILQNRFSF